MLPAVLKLCCGITYPHSRSMAGLQRTAIAVIGAGTPADLQRGGQAGLPRWWPRGMSSPWQPAGSEACHSGERRRSLKEEEVKEEEVTEEEGTLVQQGQEALKKALAILEDKKGWNTEISEENGVIVYSKVLPGAKKVFRLEAELEASPEKLHDILFVKVEEMNVWNPNVGRIKILRRINAETMVTHEVSAETAGNLIGQRDFLSIRHCSREDSRIYLAGTATHLDTLPPQSGFVRAEDGPTCIILQAADSDTGRSRLTWLLNMDVKGWLPKSIVNQALPRAQVDFTRHLRRRLAEASAPRWGVRRRSGNPGLGDEGCFGAADRIGAAM
ncbi:steroidogenic acute regulatory protein, mitochondrial [Clupea harengus]|uniref:START domain-containing protein 1 n=1 Tax=Clupea harengus TaxID=7950 RepID=A0A6P8EWJ6_CLUHA|nr:steroidogenic acute regulatory protein, mitochondrial [Clupea harengus]